MAPAKAPGSGTVRPAVPAGATEFGTQNSESRGSVRAVDALRNAERAGWITESVRRNERRPFRMPHFAFRVPEGGWTADVLPPVLAATLVACAAELLLLRLMSRIGVHIPALPWLRGIYGWSVQAGTFAFPIAAILAAALLAVLCVDQARHLPLVAGLGLALLSVNLLQLVRPDPAGITTAYGLLVVAALVVAAGAAIVRFSQRRVGMWLLVVALGESLGVLRAAVAAAGVAAPGPMATLGEWLVVAALVATPLLAGARTLRREPLLAGLPVGMFVAAAFAFGASTGHILALWTFGFSMVAPTGLYVLAAAAVVAAVLALATSGRAMPAAAIALIAAAGYAPANSYQITLLLCGVLLILRSEFGEHRPT